MAAIRDSTLTFRRLCDAAAGPEGDEGERVLFADPGAYDSWATGWRRRLEEETVSGQASATVMGREDVKTTMKCLHPNTSGSAVIVNQREQLAFLLRWFTPACAESERPTGRCDLIILLEHDHKPCSRLLLRPGSDRYVHGRDACQMACLRVERWHPHRRSVCVGRNDGGESLHNVLPEVLVWPVFVFSRAFRIGRTA